MTAQVRIVPWGGSSGIRIPAALLRAAHLSQDDDVRISVTAHGVLTVSVVESPKTRHPHRTIQERFTAFNGEVPPLGEADFGEDVGAETWR